MALEPPDNQEGERYGVVSPEYALEAAPPLVHVSDYRKRPFATHETGIPHAGLK